MNNDSSPPRPRWAAKLPVKLADLDDFCRRWNIQGAQIVVTSQGLALAYQSSDITKGDSL
jgi:hypothetical protein